jgi:hypothetical protein
MGSMFNYIKSTKNENENGNISHIAQTSFAYNKYIAQ